MMLMAGPSTSAGRSGTFELSALWVILITDGNVPFGSALDRFPANTPDRVVQRLAEIANHLRFGPLQHLVPDSIGEDGQCAQSRFSHFLQEVSAW